MQASASCLCDYAVVVLVVGVSLHNGLSSAAVFAAGGVPE